MTIEDVKKELNAYKNDCKLIDKMQEQITYYETRLTSCTIEISDMPKGSPTIQDRMAEYIAKLEDLKAEKIVQLIELEDKKHNIEKYILQLDQPYKTLLYTTYIIGNSLTETAYEMEYEYKYTCKLHGKALVEYLKVREENWNLMKN